MYVNFVDEFSGESLCYTKNEEGVMYYIQIINPTDKEFSDAGYRCDYSANAARAERCAEGIAG